MKISELVRSAAGILRSAAREEPQRDAWYLLAAAMDRDLAWVLAHPEAEPTPSSERQFTGWIHERAEGRPLAYLTGHREFYGRDFLVDPSVLIPRPETEVVVDACLKALAGSPGASGRRQSAVDIGTGSGCIAVTLAAEVPDLEVLATDVSAEALKLASTNASRLGVAGRVEFQLADLLPLPALQFDLIVSNPPYVAEGDESLEPGVRRYEPALALFAGTDGMDFYRRIIPLAAERLLEGGWLILELGYRAEPAVRSLLAPGWVEIETTPDLAGIPRCLAARKP